MQLLDGKKIANELKQEIALEVEQLIKSGKKKPHLAAILVGTDGGSETYVAAKVKACEQVGFKSSLIRFKEDVYEAVLLAKIDELNNDKDVDGFIVQLPLPKHINEEKIIEAILPRKDVDGFHPMNVGRMALGLPSYISATPDGIMELLKRNNIDTFGKHCVVMGRSNIVGAPISILMSKDTNPGNCTVSLVHINSKNGIEFTKRADILIVAIGKPGYITADMIKEGAVVVDVGITRIKDSSKKSGFRLAGDIDFENVAPKCSYISPVPGGVGPMTIASLLKNTLLSAKREIY
jgi:methylenetetrahydrofolate dehydrogenase (NADP+)/methenyltetrahydrofolate cyclohydrolase